MKATNDKYSRKLNIEAEKNAALALPIVDGSAADDAGPDHFSPHIIKLLRQLLNMIDDHYTNLSFVEKETVEDVMKYGSFQKVARLQHVSATVVRYRFYKCIDALTTQIMLWQEPHDEIERLRQKVSDLEEANERSNMMTRIKAQAEELEELKEENDRLRNIIRKSKPDDEDQKNHYMIVDARLKRSLDSSLRNYALNADLIEKLNRHNIYKLFDLIRVSRAQMLELKGITVNEVNTIERLLRRMNMHLGTEIKWEGAIREYYIKI